MDLGLRGKNAIVTGGSKGIGAGIATVLAEEGCNVVVNYRSGKESAKKFANELSAANDVRVIPICADVSKEDEADALFSEAVSIFGKIDILINNAAGGMTASAFTDISFDNWSKAWVGVLNPAFYMSNSFVKHCITNKISGHIVNVLSKSGILSSSVNNLSYVTYKGALCAMTRGMAKELIAHGIYVNGIVPGYVKTERIHVDGDERTERVRSLLPTGEFAVPRDMGNIAAILCSEKSSQMIGSIVDCTGGTLI